MHLCLVVLFLLADCFVSPHFNKILINAILVIKGLYSHHFFHFIETFLFLLYSFGRYFGIVISHYQVALYSARRDEMVEAVQSTLFYMNTEAPIPVHSTYAALPYEVRTFLYI